MNKRQIETFNRQIATFIATEAPVVDSTEDELFFAERCLSAREKKLWEKVSFGTSFEVFYKVLRLCKYLDIYDKADDEYIITLVANARKLNARMFKSDKYLQNIKVKDKHKGNYFLTNACYEPNEFFQYAMPDYDAKLTVPKLGFFDGKVVFPSVYEGNIPWVSVCPSEVSSMKQGVDNAFGNVLVLGLGLGWYAYQVSEKQNVSHVTIVDLSGEIIDLFNENILPQFANKEKVTIVKADAFKYLESVQDGEFDYCYADIWENQFDGAECYTKIKQFERNLPRTKFDYWIEKEIIWFINNYK